MNRKWKLGLLGAAAAAVALPVYLAAPGHLSKAKKQLFMGVNYAHRGLHSRDKVVPENSLEAFRRAVQKDYGMELDVQLSKDGQVVVFHDDDLARVCGVNARVDALTYEELKRLRLCGTEHTIPLFSEVLEVIGGATPLIVELKTGPRNRELCKKTYKLLKDYKGVVCIESFDPFIVAWFRFHAPKMVRGQLAMEDFWYLDEHKTLFEGFLLSRCLLNFLVRPHFIAYDVIPQKPWLVRLCEKLGALKIGWTAHEARYEEVLDGVIFEFYEPKPTFKPMKK